MKELQHLNKYFLKYKSRLLFGILITIIARIFMLFTPRFVREIFIVVEEWNAKEITDESIFRASLSIIRW